MSETPDLPKTVTPLPKSDPHPTRSAIAKHAAHAAEWFGLVGSALLWLWLASLVGTGALAVGWPALVVLLMLPIGMAAASLLTGFGHFFADNFADIETPIIGPTFIFRFRQHHDHPTIICSLGFRELNGGLALVALPFLALTVALGPVLAPVVGTLSVLLFQGFVLFTAFGVAVTNQIHRWSHDPKRPGWVVPLQKSGLILSPRQHALHHSAPFELSFCITNAWLDYWLDRWRVWHYVADALLWLSIPRVADSVMGTDRMHLARRPE